MDKNLQAAIQGAIDALKEAGKDFALASPRATRPNLYELHAANLTEAYLSSASVAADARGEK